MIVDNWRLKSDCVLGEIGEYVPEKEATSRVKKKKLVRVGD